MKTWADVKLFIAKHNLPYKVEQFNMSLRGVLVSTFDGEAVAYTVKDAARYLR
jgi:hypothetical protein